MAKHYTQKEARFQVEFRPSAQATAHSGQLAVNALFQQCGLWPRIPWGDTISESQANYFGDPDYYSYDLGPAGFNAAFDTGVFPYTSPVGWFGPNGYGLFDMAGTVFEWCCDWYGTPYGQPTTTDPTGPATGTYRLLRGGNWYGYPDLARCAARDYYYPLYPSDYYGFRCVRGF
jgi:formylglycine-generating enzyme required for sulfatase activity